MKVIVSGATGFIGRSLVKRLLEKDYEVIVLLRDESRVVAEWTNQVRFIICPNSQIKNLQQVCPDRDIDIFFQFAWHGTAGALRQDYEVQLENIRYCCDSVLGANKVGCKRYVYAGSIMEYEAMQYITSQGCSPSLNNIYSTAKLSAGFLTKIIANATEMEYVSVIISNIYGPGEKSARFLNTIVRKMLNNEAIDMTHGKQLYDFIYITDAVEEIILSAQQGVNNHSYYVGNSKQRALKEFVLEARKVLESKSVVNFGMIELSGAMLTYKEFDTEKIERELGYVPKVSFEQGIKFLKKAIEIEGEQKDD